MGWASQYIAKLQAGETVQFRPRGNSMSGKIESGQLCTVEPVDHATLRVGDMTRFRLPARVDAAICMQDSQGHLLTNEAIVAHLRCVAGAVRPGGLYVFDRYMCSSWTDPARRWSWTRRRGRSTVRATFEALKNLNPVTQTFFEDMELEAHENGQRHVYRQRHASRMVFPQELRVLVELAGGFELVEWFYGFKPHLKLDRAHHPLLMVVVLRKR